jgi:uncharacterized protein YbjT (DUF2867 family)
MRIAVAGGTGVLGRQVVDAVRAAGHDAVVIARAAGVDVISGAGLDGALEGVDTVVDASNIMTMSRSKSVAFFEAGTANLLREGDRAGVGHHVVVSIVGIDRVDYSYYEGKRAQERLALAGRVPCSVLRITQFHEFAGQLLDRFGPVAFIPDMTSQPIAGREAADAVLALALAEPVGPAPDLAGPQRLKMIDMVRAYVRARGLRRLVVPIVLPGAAGAAMRDGGLLPIEDGPRGTQTFDQWLAQTVAPAGDALRQPDGPR